MGPFQIDLQCHPIAVVGPAGDPQYGPHIFHFDLRHPATASQGRGTGNAGNSAAKLQKSGLVVAAEDDGLSEDTEFTAKLSDVHPGGLARQLCDGNVRLALREGLTEPDPVPPGEVVKVRGDLWATGHVFRAGHRIRLEVASAAVPKFAAHTNTLAPPGSATEVVVAGNRVWHTAECPSRLLLPVVPGGLS